MARAKKELIPSTPVNRISSLITRMQKSGSVICSAGDMMSRWRYIDFCNPRLSVPSISMEWLFGARGLLAGRIIQLRATFSKGKSSFMYYMYSCAQKPATDAYCFHVETEGAAAPADFIASFGCSPDKLAVAEIQSLEGCLSQIDEVIAEIRGGRGGGIDPETKKQRKTKYTDPLDVEMKAPIIMGVDSLSSLGLDDKVNEDVADLTKHGAISSHSRMLREHLRNRVGVYRDAQALIMLASHETVKMEIGKKSFGGPQKNSLGQEAIGVHATYGVDVDSHNWVDKERGVQLGSKISYHTFKNKLSPRYRKLDVFMRIDSGFDMVETDVQFLLDHPQSPFTSEECWRQGGVNSGIKCPVLSDKVFRTNEDFIRALYANTELVMKLREKLRIRGFGFAFETDYQKGLDQLEADAVARGVPMDAVDIPTEEDADGLAGDKG